MKHIKVSTEKGEVVVDFGSDILFFSLDEAESLALTLKRQVARIRANNKIRKSPWKKRTEDEDINEFIDF